MLQGDFTVRDAYLVDRYIPSDSEGNTPPRESNVSFPMEETM